MLLSIASVCVTLCLSVSPITWQNCYTFSKIMAKEIENGNNLYHPKRFGQGVGWSGSLSEVGLLIAGGVKGAMTQCWEVTDSLP